MALQTWSFVDKSDWVRGPWDTEPDKAQWQDGATGLPCLARRSPLGCWCGYVAVAEGHPLFGVGYSDCPQACGETFCEHQPDAVLSVHGGVTYSGFCQEDDPHGICHVPEPGQPAHVFWFGFDCGHYEDVVPSFGALSTALGGVYRDLSYIQDECADLAAQLQALSAPP